MFQDITSDVDGIKVKTDTNLSVECKLVIGADGVKSGVRDKIGVEMKGDKSKLVLIIPKHLLSCCLLDL